MWIPFRRLVLASLFLAGAALGVRAEEEDPGAMWSSVYGWVQTGDRLTEAEQWPLALGSYVEAQHQLEDLRDTFPDFEPEIVAYRMEALESDIQRIKERLVGGEHDITMKFIDFIESLELGQEQRFSDEFKAALETLTIAEKLLEEIVAERPGEFAEAIRSQEERLMGHIEWLDLQLNPRRPPRSSGTRVTDLIEWGTTRYVKTGDLPFDSAEDGLSSGLFPDSLVRTVEDEFEKSEAIKAP